MAVPSFQSNKIGPKIFQNRLVERLLSPHWSEPLFAIGPFVVVSFIWLLMNSSLPFWQHFLLFLCGTLLWTIMEYTFHRFILHWQPETGPFKRLMYAFHGYHHAYPKDKRKLVTPAIVSLPAGILLYFILNGIFGMQYGLGLYLGLITTYLGYDMMHAATHLAKFKWNYFLGMQKHHMRHHYREPEQSFGLTSKIWDVIFGTKGD